MNFCYKINVEKNWETNLKYQNALGRLASLKNKLIWTQMLAKNLDNSLLKLVFPDSYRLHPSIKVWEIVHLSSCWLPRDVWIMIWPLISPPVQRLLLAISSPKPWETPSLYLWFLWGHLLSFTSLAISFTFCFWDTAEVPAICFYLWNLDFADIMTSPASLSRYLK